MSDLGVGDTYELIHSAEVFFEVFSHEGNTMRNIINLPLYFFHDDELIPNISGNRHMVHTNMECPAIQPIASFDQIKAAVITALHNHQPMYPINITYEDVEKEPLEEGNLRGGPIRSNLAWMRAHPGVGQCYMLPRIDKAYHRFPGEIIPRLVGEGLEPRIALEFTGSLLDGLYKSGNLEALFALRQSLTDPRYRDRVELLGAPWGHAHAPSTRPEDYVLHLTAWCNHVSALFGLDVLARVRVFSLSEMALPIHPEIAFHMVNNLAYVGPGYRGIILQADTVETLDGKPVSNPHIPHRLVVEGAKGEKREIVAFLKEGGSIGALVGEMQHFQKALTLEPVRIGEKLFPPVVTQIHDGENCNTVQGLEFGSNYVRCVRNQAGTGVVLANPSEYWESLVQRGVRLEDLPAVRPRGQGLIYEYFRRGSGPKELAIALERLQTSHPNFSLGGLSWTPELDWMDAAKYGKILGLMEQASDVFHQHIRLQNISPDDHRYREVLYYFLNGQTSCFRWWGEKNDWTVRGEAMLIYFITLAKRYFPLG